MEFDQLWKMASDGPCGYYCLGTSHVAVASSVAAICWVSNNPAFDCWNICPHFLCFVAFSCDDVMYGVLYSFQYDKVLYFFFLL